jgi:hypothetical protein
MKDIKETNWKKYSDDSLKFILDQSEVRLSETITSFRQTADRSYILLAVLFSIISYAFSELIKENFDALILLAGGIISILLIRNNLFARKLMMKGITPEMCINKYFEKDIENQYRELIISRIITNNQSIEFNIKTINIATRSFKNSVLLFFIFAFLFGLVRFLLVSFPAIT